MLEYFIEGFYGIASAVPAIIYAAICVAAISGAYVLAIFYGGKKLYRGICFISLAFTGAFLYASIGSAAVVMACLFASLCGVFDLLLSVPRAKKRKPQKTISAKDLVLEIDRKLHSGGGNGITERRAMDESDIPLPILQNVGASAKRNLNISHARNIIERLGCFDLSAEDRARVREAEYALSEFEKDGATGGVFGVNEKLSSLIKILAKYEA